MDILGQIKKEEDALQRQREENKNKYTAEIRSLEATLKELKANVDAQTIKAKQTADTLILEAQEKLAAAQRNLQASENIKGENEQLNKKLKQDIAEIEKMKRETEEWRVSERAKIAEIEALAVQRNDAAIALSKESEAARDLIESEKGALELAKKELEREKEIIQKKILTLGEVEEQTKMIIAEKAKIIEKIQDDTKNLLAIIHKREALELEINKKEAAVITAASENEKEAARLKKENEKIEYHYGEIEALKKEINEKKDALDRQLKEIQQKQRRPDHA